MAMPTFPGVFIREVSSGVRTITGVSTSVALFVGRALSGVLNEPRTIFGFTDYVRIFGADSSFGEMTDQVRQFFLNGGQQAVVVRIANDAKTAEVELLTEAGDPSLTLSATSPGSHGETLRATVSYNTPDPERTFNLRLFRETISESGVVTESEEELHTDLSMDDASPRYVETVLELSSNLARATSVTASAGSSASISKLHYGAAAAGEDAVGAALLAAVPSGAVGRFRIQAGPGDFNDFEVLNSELVSAGTDTARWTLFTGKLTALGYTGSIEPSGYLKIEANSTDDETRVLPGFAGDVSAALGLGLSNGGLEIGRFATARPAPNGIVSLVSDTSPDAARILALSAVDLDQLRKANMVPAGLGEFAVTGITYVDEQASGTLGHPNPADPESLANLRGSLGSIAAAINAETSDWRAEVHGLRLSLVPRFGASQTGPVYTFTLDQDGYDGTGSGEVLEGASSQPRAGAFDADDPADGVAPLPGDYDAALQAVEEKVDLVNIIVLPRDVDEAVSTREAIRINASVWAQKNRAFLLVDPPAGVDTVFDMQGAVQDLRDGIVKDHSAVYFPKVEVIDSTGARKTVDPSGSMAGLMARIDASRGVWKAPAGLEAGVRGAVDVDIPMSDEQNGILNPEAVNAIRDFPEGIISWGARTMDGFDNSGNDDYKYVPVRRFALFLEESLVRGLRFAVFEPNGPALWQQIRLAAGAFLNGLFRQGAFAGEKARDAYFVKVDQETTTPTDINLGIVNVVVGFAPLKPAEFVIITIQQQTAQVQV